MRRIVLLTVTISLLLACASVPAAAQEGATELSDCDPSSDVFQECLREHTDSQDVLNWIEKSPDALTDNQKSAIHVFDAERAALSEDARKKLSDWRRWDAGAEVPDWFGATGVTETPENDESRANTRSENASSDVNKYKQIRPGQWFVEKPQFFDNGTGKAVIYSEFDGKVAFVDNGDCEGRNRGDGGVCRPDVTNADVAAGQTTTIWFDATVKPGLLSNGDQASSFNSLVNKDGNYNLAVALLEDNEELFSGEPRYDYVTVGVVSATLTLSALALLTFAFIWWRRRLLEENLLEHLQSNL